ncbi:MAG: ribosomal rRNA E-loop binding protein Ctc/L25/TL5, large subunit ribosomal protein [Candidatus Taylorbacteria bacterium]|nr:ribosomal rRNA E-loop binding protein Ctc/L25/TL5, large subunit ribosomal protein [Candidatus Taylorbacteria bacterium]
MAMLTLTTEKRDTKADLTKVRASGKMPAVFYGPKEASTSITVSQTEFAKVWKKAGESAVIILKDGSNEHEALIHEVDVHPVSGAPRHADFYVIEKGKKVKVHIPIVFNGVAPAVKDFGGILVKVLREVEIEAAPKDLPHELAVDLSTLVEMTSTITVKDIKLPAGVTLVAAPDEIVASVAVAKEEVEEVATAVDMSAIEVEKKGKEAKEGAEGEEGAAPADAKKEGKK